MTSPISRNVVAPETAEENRSGRPGGYTFNAFPPPDYEGLVIEYACIRLGDHAHVEVTSGRVVAAGDPEPNPYSRRRNVGYAGRLVLRWPEWLVLREALDADTRIRIAEVENATPAMLRRYCGVAEREDVLAYD